MATVFGMETVDRNKQTDYVSSIIFSTRYRHVRSFLLFFFSSFPPPALGNRLRNVLKPLPPKLFTFGWLEIDPLFHCTLWEHRADHSYENLIVSHANGSEIDVYRFHVNVSLQWRQPTVTRSFLSRLYVRVFFLPSMTARHTTLSNLHQDTKRCNMTFLSGLNDTCVKDKQLFVLSKGQFSWKNNN